MILVVRTANPEGGDEPPLCVLFLELPEKLGWLRCLCERVSGGGRSPFVLGKK